MSQTKVWATTKATTVRTLDSGGSGQGAGKADLLTVGRRGASGTRRNYKAFIRFTTNWSGVKSIVSAVLTLTTAETFDTKETPKVTVRRLLDGFTEGTAEGFDSDDYTTAATTTSSQVTKSMARDEGGVTNIDITAIVKKWAPGSVVGGSGSTSAADDRNYGIALVGSTDTNDDWVGYSDDWNVSGQRPYITLTYEEGPTTPNAPTNLSPVGTVLTIDAFEADFSDPRATDTLAVTEVEFFANSPEKTYSASSSTNLLARTNHGLKVGDMLRITDLQDGDGLSNGGLYYVRSVPDTGHFKVSTTAGGAVVDIKTSYGTGDITAAKVLWRKSKPATETERLADHSFVLPDGLHPTPGVVYTYRVRQKDQEARWSPWTAFTSVTVTDVDPNAPTGLTPDIDSIAEPADPFDSLAGVIFRTDPWVDGTTDTAGDRLSSFQFQMSAYGPDDPNWDDASLLVWDTGRVYVAADATTPEAPYGGKDLLQGTWYWRARWWDQRGGLSDWAYASISLEADFNADPGSQTNVQITPTTPWRLRIREMKFNTLNTGAITGSASNNTFTTAKNHGLKANRRVRFSSITGGTGLFTDRTYYVASSGLGAKTFKVSESKGGAVVDFTSNVTAAVLTGVTTRGPGNTVAIIENAKSVGASIVWNSPGEAHFTLPVDHPLLSVIEPKQVHYGIDFYTGDGWRETYAGLVWDVDANEQDVVFPCIDYLGLLDKVYDERYYPNEPDRSYSKGGSKYSNVAIRTIILDQLNRARTLPNSPVGFISVGTIGTMDTKVTIWSTMQPVLSFIGGLIQSHRQGSGRKTRLQVKRTSGGGYQFVLDVSPGQHRDNLRMRFGETINAYRVILFGQGWASVVHGVGRTRDGVRVLYKTANAPGIDQSVWGRFATAQIMDNVSDPNDLSRRVTQAALKAGRVGSGLALAIRTGSLMPRNGYDVTDDFPVDIRHGAVNTSNYGTDTAVGGIYYTCWAIAWEGSDTGESQTILTLAPLEDNGSPDQDLIDGSTVETRAEWQVGWTPPDPIKASSRYWLDQSTGIVYYRDDDTNTAIPITGTAEP